MVLHYIKYFYYIKLHYITLNIFMYFNEINTLD